MSILGIPERRRRLIIPTVGVALAAFFFFGFQPIARRADSLEAPLTAAWKKLSNAVGESNATTLDFDSIAAKLGQTRQSLEVVSTARQQAAARVELGAELRERINSPFQLVDFQNEVQKQITDLTKLAQQNHVTLAPRVADGFPEHTTDVKQPELLWAELFFVTDLLTLAVNSHVTAIDNLSLPQAPTNASVSGMPPRLVEIPVQLELKGPARNVTRFLESLPRRAVEIEAEGLPAGSSNRPALFIDRFLLRKESPDKVDDVRLSLRAVGFVFRE